MRIQLDELETLVIELKIFLLQEVYGENNRDHFEKKKIKITTYC